jgi:cytochrome b involved in lipid metabolism
MKQALLAVIVIALVAVGGFAITRTDDSTSNNLAETTEPSSVANQTSAPAQGQSESSDLPLFKTEEVATHASEDDCWTIVNGGVFDITSYVPRHPGGDEILRACGTDGTSLFETRTTEDGEEVGPGTPHSSNAAKQLANFKVGVLDTTAE